MRLIAPSLTLAIVLLAAGCGGSSGSTGTIRPAGGSQRPTTSATPRPSASGSPAAAASMQALPDGTRRLLPGHRVVAFYGAAGAPKLGVLGKGSPEQVWPRLARQARAYRGKGPTVMPAYELITYVATSGGGNAAQRVPSSTIKRYAASARRHHALLILDIQPGRGSFLHDAHTLRSWLTRPDVALALDPEWKLHGNEQPAAQIGHTDAAAINAVSSWLDQLTAKLRLPQKLLLVHQFTADMIRDKHDVAQRPHLATVFNMDGFGSRAGKLSKYRLLAKDHRFPIGLKLFYTSDVHMFSAREAARLHPSPDIVDYE
jgi:hypothetical protein